jgi:long-subunit acyl-CoA synthetase (AMP-forming)
MPISRGILALLNQRSTSYGDRIALSIREDGQWTRLSYNELSNDSNRLSEYLIEQGFPRGSRIAIFSESRPEWAVAFFAAVRCGAIVVPLDPSR